MTNMKHHVILIKKRSAGMKYAEPNTLEAVAQFHKVFQCPILQQPAIPSEDRCEIRVALLNEEIQDLHDAVNDMNLLNAARALADIQYALSGAVLEFGTFLFSFFFHFLSFPSFFPSMEESCMGS